MRPTRRLLLTGVALLIPVAGLTVGLASGTAGAATGKLTCTTITGNASTTTTISGCTGGNTGGSSEALNSSELATGGTIDWVSGSTTTIAAPTLTSESPTKCPGYTKPPKGTTPPEPSADLITDTVTADTGDGIYIPGTVTGEVCIGTDGTISALKPLKTTWEAMDITCTNIDGTAAGNVTVSGCTGGDTGGSSEAAPGTTLETGGTVHWVSGSSTTINAPTLTTVSATKCPGYVKKASSEPTAESFTATVTADTGDGLKLPGTAKGAVCIGNDANATITALKPLTLK